MENIPDEKNYLAMADFLIPAHGKMPCFSDACSFADVLESLDFRIDLKEGFARALDAKLEDGAEAWLEYLNAEDREAFTSVTTITVATYYMNPAVRELIGYPGQENISYDSKATQSYLTDGSLGRVIGRGRKYRPSPGL